MNSVTNQVPPELFNANCDTLWRTLSDAYYHSLLFTGRVVMLTGLTLAFGVATWVLSPIKFQADMGLLLAFMFLWNMLGALIFLPALAKFLLVRQAVKPGATVEQRTSGATPLAPTL